MNLQKENSRESTQEILFEIIKSIKEKFFQPLVNENKRLASAMEQERETISEIKERLDRVERKVEENPVTVLAGIRDAIEQSHGGKDDESN